MLRHVISSLAALCALHTSVSAAVSVTFSQATDGWSYHERIVTGTAGVHNTPYWNNVSTSTANVSASNLLGEQGLPSGMNFSTTGNFVYFNYNNVDSGNANSQTQRNNTRLMSTHIGTNSTTPATLNLSGLTGTYDVIVYLGIDADGRAGSITNGSTTYYYTTQNNTTFEANPVFLQATATSAAGATTANYAIFRGLTGATQTFSVARGGSSNVGFSGFQILIPEPDAPALAALGALGLLSWRRRQA